jgi:hypothetical protein
MEDGSDGQPPSGGDAHYHVGRVTKRNESESAERTHLESYIRDLRSTMEGSKGSDNQKWYTGKRSGAQGSRPPARSRPLSPALARPTRSRRPLCAKHKRSHMPPCAPHSQSTLEGLREKPNRQKSSCDWKQGSVCQTLGCS